MAGINVLCIQFSHIAVKMLCLYLFALRLHGGDLRLAYPGPPLLVGDWMSDASVGVCRPLIGG